MANSTVNQIDYKGTLYDIEDSEARNGLATKADADNVYTKNEVDTALSDKVDKETGKGLSTNDYTDTEKTKLAGIAEGAEVNVQSNWTQTTTTADDYIKNKPTLGTAAAKNATDTYDATGTDVTTGKAVAAALATLPEPMVFKGSLGTGGTITTLPTASSSNKGYVYKVITAGTYASQSAKVGDTFISDGSVWVLIPSGDEPSGTVTNVAVANGGGLTVSGSPITSSGTITIGHSNSVTAKTSSSLKKFTYDAHGHVTDSSELSTAESNALASGIDSTKVGQISTNQTNIGKVQTQANWNTNNGVKNLLTYESLRAGQASGATFTINNDGSITVNTNGTLANDAYMIFNLSNNNPSASTDVFVDKYCNGEFVLSGCPTGGGIDTYSMYAAKGSYTKYDFGSGVILTPTSETNILLVVMIKAGQNKSNLVFRPMIRPAFIEDDTFEPYSLPNTKITPELIELVDSGAKNVFNEPVITTGSAGEINITDNGDGTFTLNTSGATTVNSGVRIGWFTGKQGVTYAVSNYSPSCQLRIRYGSDIILDTSGGANTFVAPSNAKGELIWYVPSGTTLTNYVLKPMVCTKAAWDVSQKFVPYRPTYEETVEQVAENKNNILKCSTYTATVSPVSGTATFTELLRNARDALGVSGMFTCEISVYTETSGEYLLMYTQIQPFISETHTTIVSNVLAVSATNYLGTIVITGCTSDCTAKVRIFA